MGNIISTRFVLVAALALAALGGLAGCASTPSRSEVFADPLKRMKITSHFGQRNGRPHYGVDVPAKRGTPVMASASGEVTFAGTQRGFGKIVIVQHARGFQTYYAHLSSISVRKGRQVDQGDMVGKIGKTGNATGYHLHFEIRRNKRPLDPVKALGRSPFDL